MSIASGPEARSLSESQAGELDEPSLTPPRPAGGPPLCVEGCGRPVPDRIPGRPGRWRLRCLECVPSKEARPRPPSKDLRLRLAVEENDRLRADNGRLRERLEAATGLPALVGVGDR